MLDGHRPAGELAVLMPAAQLARILDELSALGPIATAVGTSNDAARLAPVKARLARAAETYLGLIAADLVRQIDTVTDAHGLQRAIGHWHMAMQDSRYGRAAMESQMALVKAALHAFAQAPA
jgi:hypothetical protein